MGLGTLVVRAARLCPWIVRPLLVACLRSGLPIRPRFEWLVRELRRALTPAAGASTRMVRIARGLKMEVDVRSSVGSEIYYRGSCEINVARFIERTLTSGQVLLDCGANIGEMSLRASRIVGPEGRIYAVEPSPGTAAMLRKNAALNQVRNIEVLEVALSSHDANSTFFMGAGSHSQTSSLWQPRDYAGEQTEVRSMTLMTLLAENRISQIDLIKLDIEGAELAVLQSAGPGLKRLDRFPVLVFEYNKRVADRVGWKLNDVLDVLVPLGYEVFYLNDSGPPRAYDPADAQEFDDQTNIDLICRPKGR